MSNHNLRETNTYNLKIGDSSLQKEKNLRNLFLEIYQKTTAEESLLDVFSKSALHEQAIQDEVLQTPSRPQNSFFDPQYKIPIGSTYTKWLGNLARKIDKVLPTLNVPLAHSPSLNVGEFGIPMDAGGLKLSDLIPNVETAANLAPFVGDVSDPEGKYSISDLMFGAGEGVGAAAAITRGTKGARATSSFPYKIPDTFKNYSNKYKDLIFHNPLDHSFSGNKFKKTIQRGDKKNTSVDYEVSKAGEDKRHVEFEERELGQPTVSVVMGYRITDNPALIGRISRPLVDKISIHGKGGMASGRVLMDMMNSIPPNAIVKLDQLSFDSLTILFNFLKRSDKGKITATSTMSKAYPSQRSRASKLARNEEYFELYNLFEKYQDSLKASGRLPQDFQMGMSFRTNPSTGRQTPVIEHSVMLFEDFKGFIPFALGLSSWEEFEKFTEEDTEDGQ